MPSPYDVEIYVGALKSTRTLADIGGVLRDTCTHLGVRYFALTQHADTHNRGGARLRVHNYPEAWVELFDQERRGLTDPVHRASQASLLGFRWTSVPSLIALSARDGQILATAQAYGLGGGFTVPANVPGELLGSCSFVAAEDDDLRDDVLPYAQLAGQFAYEAMRRLTHAEPRSVAAGTGLTDRQIQCVLWVGRGKTDWEIAQILGLSLNTVVEHLRNARRRYLVVSRAMLPVRALFDGALSFADFLGG